MLFTWGLGVAMGTALIGCKPVDSRNGFLGAEIVSASAAR